MENVKKPNLQLPPPVVGLQYQMRVAANIKVVVRHVDGGMVTVSSEVNGDWDPMPLHSFWYMFEPEPENRAKEEESWKAFFEAINPSSDVFLRLIVLTAELLRPNEASKKSSNDESAS